MKSGLALAIPAGPCDDGGMNLKTYLARPDADILAAIRELSVPKEILLDPNGWKTLCAVRSRHMGEVSGEVWSELCRLRSQLVK